MKSSYKTFRLLVRFFFPKSFLPFSFILTLPGPKYVIGVSNNDVKRGRRSDKQQWWI